MAREILSCCPACSSDAIHPLHASDAVSVCARCGLFFENPRPFAEDIRAFYSRDGQYDGWLGEIAERESLWRRRLAKVLKSNPGRGSMLDAGAGLGQFLSHAAPLFTAVTGTEVSSSAIRTARERYNLNLIEGKLEDVSLEGSYSIITAFHVLEHVPFPGKFLDRCLELLGEGGVLVVAVPNDVFSFNARMRRLFKMLKWGRFAHYNTLGLPRLTLNEATEEVHLSHFTEKTLKRLLHDRGFVVERASLDPFFVARGPRLLKQNILYGFYAAVHAVTGVNLYETLWVSARKPAAR
jgi:2-polyprenyl-3-methyl-5-hydroxy-6-metoxy-1,4-benzoquinol methylase